MFFRGRILSCFILIFGLSSCSWWGDKVSENKGISLSAGDMLRFGDINCIRDIGVFFADFFKGHSSEPEIRSMQNCIKSTLDSMFDIAYKDDNEGFNRKRIRNLLVSFLGNSGQYDIDNLSELIFRLKRFFVGGGKNSFFKEEWNKFKPDLAELADALVSSYDAAKIIFFSKKEEDNLLAREDFYSRLSESFRIVDRVKNRHLKTLEIEEIDGLVTVLLKTSNLLKRFIPISMTAREIVYPTEGIFELGQSTFVRTVWDVFELQARLREVNSKNILVGESSADVVKSLGILTDKFKSWSEEYPETYSFSIDQVKNLISQMFEIGFLKKSMKSITPVNETVKNIFTRVFGDGVIKRKDFKLLSDTFESWIKYYPKLLKDLELKWAQDVYSVLKKEGNFNDKNAQMMDDLLNDFEKPKFISGSNVPIHISYSKERYLTPEENYFDRSFKQLSMVLAALLMRAYNPELNKGKSGLDVSFDKKGLSRLLYDFRPLGLELGFVNRYSCNSFERIFKEADILTRNANGDGLMSLIETAEWFGTMVVTASLTEHVFSRIEKKCAFEGEKSYGYPFYNRSCFKKSLFNDKGNLENYFPNLSVYMKILRSESMRQEFEEKIGEYSNIATYYYKYQGLNSRLFKTLFINQMNTCFYAKKNIKSYLEFPLSRVEFNAVVAALIYLENSFEEYDTSGFSSGWTYSKDKDPEGADLIIDGQEFSAFVKDRVSRENMGSFIKLLQDNNLFVDLTGPVIDWALKNMLETSIKLDRQRVMDIFKNAISDSDGTAIHPLELNFCEEVMSGKESGSVSYDTEAVLQCSNPIDPIDPID